jgi:hypothetical protein
MRNLLAAATAATLITVAPAIGQPVVVSAEQRAQIKKYIVEEKIRPTKLVSRVAVGATMPEAVELMPVPESWGATLRLYHFVYTGTNVVLVAPTDRRVVEVIN